MAKKQMKSCDPNIKQQLQQAGCHLTREQETLLADITTVDWGALIKVLGSKLPQVFNILLTVLALFNGPTPPTPTQGGHPAMKCDPNDNSCDHCACACAVLEAALKTADLAAQHVCCCHCEDSYG